MHCHAQLPEAFPKHCLDEALAIARGGESDARLAELDSHLWNLEGWIRGEVFGRPQCRADGAHGADQIPREAAIELLEGLRVELANDQKPPGTIVSWTQSWPVASFCALLGLLNPPPEEPAPAAAA